MARSARSGRKPTPDQFSFYFPDLETNANAAKEHSRISMLMNPRQIAEELSSKNGSGGKKQIIYKTKHAKVVENALERLQELGVHPAQFARHAVWLRAQAYKANWPLMELHALEHGRDVVDARHPGLVRLHYELIEHPEITSALSTLGGPRKKEALRHIQTVFDAFQNRIDGTMRELGRKKETERQELKNAQNYEPTRAKLFEAVERTTAARAKYLKKLPAK